MVSMTPLPTMNIYHPLGEDDPDETEPSQQETFSSQKESRRNHFAASTGTMHAPFMNTGIGIAIIGRDISPHHEQQRRQQQKQRRLAVVLLSACTVLVFADQNLMSPNLTAIADYFGFDDEQRDRKLGGDIALAFFLLGAPASFVIGCLADHCDRTKLFSATIFCGEGACLATFWVNTYPQLYACRAITGLSVGGALPLIYSILGDMFAAEDRHEASSLVGIGMGIGISLGQGIAGFIGPRLGWRVPFLIVSVPALMFAAAFRCLIDDPKRGCMEEAVLNQQTRQYEQQEDDDDIVPLPIVDVKNRASTSIEMSPLENDEDDECDQLRPRETRDEIILRPMLIWKGFDVRVHWAAFVSLLSTPTLVLTLLQGAPGCLPWGIVNTYLNDFLAVDRGMTVERATFTVLLFGVGNFFGMLMGGYGGAYLYRQDKRYPAVLAGSMAILGCFPFWILLNRVNSASSICLTGPVAIFAGLCSGVTGPIIKATLQNVTLPQTRGQAFALLNTFDDFGRGLGPVFVAILISSLGGRTPAFNVGVLGWIACGILNMCVFFTVKQDESKLQARIAERLSELPSTIEDSTSFSGNAGIGSVPLELPQPKEHYNVD